MLLQIVKEDLKKRKSINLILFLFITLATIFLSSSVNNIMVVSSAVDYYLDYSHVPQMDIISSSLMEKTAIETWLQEVKEEDVIQTYGFDELLALPDKSIWMDKDGSQTLLDTGGVSIFITSNNVSYDKVFNQKGEEFQINNQEIALPVAMMTKNDLQIGDHITLMLKDESYTFTIKEATKDAAFGSEMGGMLRIFVNEEMHHTLATHANSFGLYHVETQQEDTFKDRLSEQNFSSIMSTIDRGMYKLLYSFDMITASLLIAVGIALILIALLVLRFTLVFTMEEQYQEIGILKAIGLRGFAIKKLYLIKYFFLVCTGAFLGCLCSIPISKMSTDSVSTNMIMEDTNTNLLSNILCAIFVVLLVICFCYFCTRKINKVSAITAIHGGHSGERFHKHRSIALSKQYHIPVWMYLGINDITTHMRRYVVLIVTFCISFVLITIPLNTINTMRSDEMIRKFGIDPSSSIHTNEIEGAGKEAFQTSGDVGNGLKRLKQEFQDAGYEVELRAELLLFTAFQSSEQAHYSDKIMMLQIYGGDDSFLDYSEGSAPKLANEIAFSKDVMKTYHWEIGDYVEAQIDGKLQTFLITGTYSDYMQMGTSGRFSSAFDSGEEVIFECANIMVDMDTTQSQLEMKEELSKTMPQYQWKTAQDILNQNIGGMQEMLAQLLYPMTAMLCAIIMLISLLMEKLFITREKGEIAMMKSIGFTNKTICLWQMMRILCVVISSMLISIPLSFISNTFILKPIFAIMGAEVQIQVNALQAYGIYPAILTIGILLATLFATRSLRNIDIREMNVSE